MRQEIPRLQPRGGSQEELNGCYAMLCEALRAWHRMQKDQSSGDRREGA